MASVVGEERVVWCGAWREGAQKDFGTIWHNLSCFWRVFPKNSRSSNGLPVLPKVVRGSRMDSEKHLFRPRRTRRGAENFVKPFSAKGRERPRRTTHFVRGGRGGARRTS